MYMCKGQHVKYLYYECHMCMLIIYYGLYWKKCLLLGFLNCIFVIKIHNVVMFFTFFLKKKKDITMSTNFNISSSLKLMVNECLPTQKLFGFRVCLDRLIFRYF